ncbi:MAG: MotA/TolQ/ExbB proton channel family protein [Bdellovibrionota bacterium]
MLSEKIFTLAQYADQVVLFVLVLMSVVSVGMIFERYIVLKKISENSAAIRLKIKSILRDNNLMDFEELAKDTDSLEGRAAAQALRHLKESGLAGTEEIFNAFMLNEKPELEKYLAMLATVASNAPFIGLLGTVLGIMKAFNDLAQASDAGQQTVMAGISVALIATAAGLFVAIPAGVFYNYYNRKVKSIFISLESVKELALAYAKKKGLN